MSVLTHILLDSGKAPQHSVIWLHGLGADGSDFVPMVEELKLPVPVRFLFPHAPMRPVTINGGFVMRAWYDIVATDIGAKQDSRAIRNSQAELEKLIAMEVARGVAPEHIFLAGFSQGGAIVLHTGLRHAAKLGGILALSTYLPLADTLADEASAAARATPIFMAHGRSDPVVPYALGKLSEERLLAHGCTLEWHEYAMPHSVCQPEIADIERWLIQQLSANPA
ncbi:carboxylesterase [Ferriphaselus sp. R-1]|uniref:alpha/beta hydrolase n=1 Tax=Ferriphaselus sp. R-1 TaxID=1485544 RepID=UPI00054F33D4|nr:carboxylesterase [Ferriphaselus sp. R-1]